MRNERYRAIIIVDDNILVMKRNKNGYNYSVLPGGGIEKEETPEECCKRELMEEFGIEIEPLQMIYLITQAGTKQGFFVAKWLSGEIHKTDAEEYTCDSIKYGTFEPSIVPISSLDEINLVPHEVKEQLQKDLIEYGKELNRPLIEFDCKWE